MTKVRCGSILLTSFKLSEHHVYHRLCIYPNSLPITCCRSLLMNLHDSPPLNSISTASPSPISTWQLLSIFTMMTRTTMTRPAGVSHTTKFSLAWKSEELINWGFKAYTTYRGSTIPSISALHSAKCTTMSRFSRTRRTSTSISV